MRKYSNLLFLFILVASSPAYAIEMVDLVRQAIDKGTATGEMTGDVADKFKETTKSKQPITAKITTIKKVNPECARLQFSLHQEGAALKNGGTAPITSEFSANFCKNGPPKGFDDAN